MIPFLLIHPDIKTRAGKIEEYLHKYELRKGHPDVMWIEEGEKIGVEVAKKIRERLNLRPHQGLRQGVVIAQAEKITPEAQNSLLKTLEEPPIEALIILGSPSVDYLLPTIISRCQVVFLAEDFSAKSTTDQGIEKLINLPLENRFQFIDKCEDKESLFDNLVDYFHQKILNNSLNIDQETSDFLNDLLETQKWKAANVNIRAILEYLMLKIPENINKSSKKEGV